MVIAKTAMAGTLESNDVMVRVSPGEGEVVVRVQSIVVRQFGERMIEVAAETARSLGVKSVLIDLDDRGAVDCTIRARVETALLRAKGEKA